MTEPTQTQLVDALHKVSNLNHPAFAAPLNWIEDPQANMLHTDSSCTRLYAADGAPVGFWHERELTIQRALTEHRLCPTCWDGGAIMAYGRAVILQAARMLLEIERKLPKRRQCQRKIVSEMSNIEILHNNFENEDLLCELEDVDISDPIIVAWKTRLLENIRNSNTLIVDTAQRDTEILHKAAAEVLENELYGYEKHPTLICQNEITALFGSLRSGAKLHPVTKLLQQWFISLHAGMTPSETRRQLGADREAVAGYNSAEERALLIRLLTDWERRMDDLTAEKPAVLLGAIHPSWVTKRRRYGGGGITSDRYVRNHTVIVSSLPWIHSTNTSALICHPTIATYAARDGGDMGSASLADYATPVPLTGLLTDSDVVNMLSLWNPHDSASVYHTVAAALKATKLL